MKSTMNEANYMKLLRKLVVLVAAASSLFMLIGCAVCRPHPRNQPEPSQSRPFIPGTTHQYPTNIPK